MLTGSTPYARLGLEGIVDTGIIVLTHFKNPAREHAARLLYEALTFRRRILIPLTTYLGAYIIMTRYLKLRRGKVARSLLETLSLNSPAFYEDVPKVIIERAVATASELNLSPWDTYLIELAKELKIPTIYSIDEELAGKARGIKVVNPIPQDVMREYHRYIEERLRILR